MVHPELGRLLKEAFQKYNLEVRGVLPNLKSKFYRLNFDLYNNRVTVWYGPEQEKLFTMVIDPYRVVEKLYYIDKDITEERFPPEIFLRMIYRSYRQFAQHIGDRVKIIDIFNTISHRYYKRYHFSYDLYRLFTKHRKYILEDEGVRMHLAIATRAFTQRRSDFLWIPSDERGEGSYFSHIYFEMILPKK